MRWFGRRAAPAGPVFADDGTLVVLLAAHDPAQADSAVLAAATASGVDTSQPLLLRQHLVLPDAAAVEVARELLARDGYQLTVGQPPVGQPPVGQLPAGPGPYDVLAWRTQVVTAMSAAQERSRAAGLAQRLGGDVRGWDALGPAGPGPAG